MLPLVVNYFLVSRAVGHFFMTTISGYTEPMTLFDLHGLCVESVARPFVCELRRTANTSGYSFRNESTGFDNAALADWYPTESNTIINIANDVNM